MDPTCDALNRPSIRKRASDAVVFRRHDRKKALTTTEIFQFRVFNEEDTLDKASFCLQMIQLNFPNGKYYEETFPTKMLPSEYE